MAFLPRPLRRSGPRSGFGRNRNASAVHAGDFRLGRKGRAVTFHPAFFRIVGLFVPDYPAAAAGVHGAVVHTGAFQLRLCFHLRRGRLVFRRRRFARFLLLAAPGNESHETCNNHQPEEPQFHSCSIHFLLHHNPVKQRTCSVLIMAVLVRKYNSGRVE